MLLADVPDNGFIVKDSILAERLGKLLKDMCIIFLHPQLNRTETLKRSL